MCKSLSMDFFSSVLHNDLHHAVGTIDCKNLKHNYVTLVRAQ